MPSDSSAGSSDFIFARSRIVPESKPTGFPSWRPSERIPYEPTEEDEAEWVSKNIQEQLISTVSTIQEMEFRDEEHVYIVIGLSKKQYIREYRTPRIRISVFDSNIRTVLDRLSAEVLAYLNDDHNKLLVECPLANLIEILRKKKYANKYFQDVERISPLLLKEQISKQLMKDSEWHRNVKPVLIQLIPNTSQDIRQQHLRIISVYLEGTNASVTYSDRASGFIFTNLNLDEAERLLKESNFIFKIDGVPQGIIENEVDRIDGLRIPVSSQLLDSETGELPLICLMDSGVSNIEPLRRFVVVRDGSVGFRDFYDGCSGDGHGTPIACLATFGEHLDDAKARIISYKLYSEDRAGDVFPGFLTAITKYSGQCRIFLSSINFRNEAPEATANLDRLIQEKNICMVSSAGNILMSTIFECIGNGLLYPTYIPNYHVQDPARAVNIVAVGAISKKHNLDSIARSNQIAPFSRCGSLNPSLYECPKPEFVEHGGNIGQNETEASKRAVCLESYSKNGTRAFGIRGTSFSSPLFARRLAEIEAKYGGSIRNAETLKALALASTNHLLRHCMGFGETSHFCGCDRTHALIFSEETLPLPTSDPNRTGYNVNYHAEIQVSIPRYINMVEMFLVHFDNFVMATKPSLNTYLKVYAEKTGRDEGYVELDNPDEREKKSHMKVFRWAFSQRSMAGDWTFKIRPEITSDIIREHRSQIRIRYGCAILITAREPPVFSSLSDEINGLMSQRGYL